MIAFTMVDRPGAVRIRGAASRAASVAPLTAMPQSACFKAGASFTPSPVMATMWPRDCKAFTISYLCCGNTRAKPSAVSTARATSTGAWSPFFLASKISAAATRWSPRPSCAAISSPIATSSPVTILTERPSFFVSATVCLASGRGGFHHGQDAKDCPGLARVFGLGDAQGPYPRPASALTVPLYFSRTGSFSPQSAATACGAPLA